MRSFSLIRWEMGGGFEVVAVGVIAGGGDLSRRPQGGAAMGQAARSSGFDRLPARLDRTLADDTSNVRRFGIRPTAAAHAVREEQVRQALEFAGLYSEDCGDNAIGSVSIRDSGRRKAEFRKDFGR